MEYIISLSVFILFMLLACAIGRKLLRVFGINFHSAEESFVFAFGIGFAAIAYIVLFLGMAGVLYRWLAVVIFTIISLVVLPEIKDSFEWILKGGTSLKNTNSAIEGVLKVFIALAALIMLLGALAPSYSNDSMSYHLTDAKYFVSTHSIGQIPNNSTNALWPYLVEMYFTLAILLRLLPMAGLFHFSLAAFSAVGVYALSKRLFSHRTGLFAAALFILTPGIFMEAKETYVDLGMVFYTLAAVYAFLVWMNNPEKRWLALSGAMCGFAISVKFFIAIVPAILSCYLAFAIFKKRKRERLVSLKGTIVFFIAASLTSFVWYLRQYIATGNPFFPFFYKIFGTSSISVNVLELLSEKVIRSAYGIGTSLKSFIVLPWQITIHPDRFGGEQLGPVFLAFMPALLLIKRVDRNIKRILAFSFIYLVAWFFTYQNLRFLLPVAAFLSIIVAYVLVNVQGKTGIFKKVLWMGAMTCLLFSLALCLYHNFQGAKVVLGFDSKGSYLSRNERSYDISEYINNNISNAAKILVVNEGHTFFIDKDNKREIYFWIYMKYEDIYGSPEAVMDFFKSQGFTHILYAEFGDEPRQGGNRLTSLMQDSKFRNEHLKLLYEERPASANANGVKYLLFKI